MRECSKPEETWTFSHQQFLWPPASFLSFFFALIINTCVFVGKSGYSSVRKNSHSWTQLKICCLTVITFDKFHGLRLWGRPCLHLCSCEAVFISIVDQSAQISEFIILSSSLNENRSFARNPLSKIKTKCWSAKTRGQSAQLKPELFPAQNEPRFGDITNGIISTSASAFWNSAMFTHKRPRF